MKFIALATAAAVTVTAKSPADQPPLERSGKPELGPNEKAMQLMSQMLMPQVMPNPPTELEPGKFFQIMPGIWSYVRDERTILQANLNLLSSTYSQPYSDEAFGAIQAIQGTCEPDYSRFCGPASLMTDRPPLASSSRHNQHKSKSESRGGSGVVVFFVETVNSLMDFMNWRGGSPPVFVDIDDDETIREFIGDDDQDNPCEKQHTPPPEPEPIQRRQLRGDSSSSDSQDSYSEFDDDDDDSEKQYDPQLFLDRPLETSPPPHPPPPPPLTFLGFGQEGDTCLMAHYSSLSIPCQNFLDEIFLLREEYVSHEPNPCLAFALGVLSTLAVTAILFLISRRCRPKVPSPSIASTGTSHNNEFGPSTLSRRFAFFRSSPVYAPLLTADVDSRTEMITSPNSSKAVASASPTLSFTQVKAQSISSVSMI
jgi:hypothetical protein